VGLSVERDDACIGKDGCKGDPSGRPFRVGGRDFLPDPGVESQIMRPALLALGVALAVVGLSAQRSPSAPVVFRAAVDFVEVDATVTDARGDAVSDLTAADFEVFEDGTRQEIASFARVELPARPAVPSVTAVVDPTILPDVQTNAPIEGGIYLIVLDDLHTGFGRTARVREIARQFIERAVGPGDVAAVVHTGHNEANQDFTGNRQLLLRAVDEFAGDKLRSATLVSLEGVRPDPQTGELQLGEDMIKDVRAYRARSVMASIRQLSEFMAAIQGRRKVMVLFGEGIDYDIDNAIGPEGSTADVIRDETRTAIASAQRGNVTIYSVDPRGVFDPVDDLVQTASQFNRDSRGNPAAQRIIEMQELISRGVGRKPPPVEASGSTIQKEVRAQQNSLRALAQDTGGFATLNTNNFLRPFDRIVRENNAYYLIGYQPSNDERDGRRRKLEVRVKRPGLTVRARNGYLALRSGTPASSPAGDTAASPVLEALGSPLPVSGLPMRVFAAPFKGVMHRSTVTFAVELDPSAFNFAHRNGRWVETLEIATVIVPAGGTPRPGDHSKKALALTPALYEAVKSRGARIVGQTDLPSGRYQLRVAAVTSGRAGSTVYDLEVPDYSTAPLALSGLVLTSDDSLQTPTMPLGIQAPTFSDGPPAATRSFSRTDRLTVFGEVYDNARTGAAHEVSITTTLRSATGGILRTTTGLGSSSEPAARSAVYRFSARLPLADLTPGLYAIRVEAQGDFGGRPSVSREIQILVTPR
jgi:VWFA-related protein